MAKSSSLLTILILPIIIANYLASASPGPSLGHYQILPPNYDPLKPPKPSKNESVSVDVKLSIINIRSIKETEMSFVADIFYHQYWKDNRLNFSRTQLPDGQDSIVLDSRWKDKIWIPDSYFKNALSGSVNNIIFPTMYFTISPDGKIFMAARVSLQLSCEMDFTRYPHDTQECRIELMSLSNTANTVKLQWKEFYLTSKLHMPTFYVSGSSFSTCDKTYKIGTFSCLRGTIKLTRQVGLYVVKKYIPSVLIVVMSFVGFWIPTSAYPARVALVITALLALITQQYQSAEINVSYIIALNLWMMICTTFVFFGLIEYAIAIAWEQNDTQRKQQNNNDSNPKSPTGAKLNNWVATPDSDISGSPSRVRSMSQGAQCRRKSLACRAIDCTVRLPDMLITSKLRTGNYNKVDLIARYLFPFAFMMCAAAYLIYLFAM